MTILKGLSPKASASPILVCMSRPRFAAPHLAARRCGRLPLEAGAAAIAASERRPVTGARGYPKGVFWACAPEGTALKCLLNILYVAQFSTETSNFWNYLPPRA